MYNQFFLAFLATLVSILPAIAGIFCFRWLARPAKILTFYYIFAALFGLIEYYMAINGINNVRFYHFYDPIEYFFIVFAFSYWTANKKTTLIFRYSIIGFFAISFANTFRMPNLNQYSSNALTVAYLAYVFISSSTIYNIIKRDTGKMTANPVFWLALSLFVLSSNNGLWYAISDYLQYNLFYKIFLNIHNAFNLISSVLAAIGLILYKYPAKTDQAPEASIYWN